MPSRTITTGRYFIFDFVLQFFWQVIVSLVITDEILIGVGGDFSLVSNSLLALMMSKVNLRFHHLHLDTQIL
jgi:hypothetical protein